MKNILNIFILIAIHLFIVNNSFAITGHLRTEEIKKEDIRGVFTLILYGSRDINDIETVAILDLEGDQYTLEPYAPKFDYRIKGGLSGKEALDEGHKFISYHNSFYRSRLSRIIDDKGNTIGYELRPLYMPFTFGVSDVLEVDYWLRDGKVKVTIRILPSIERGLPERTLVS
ncbi:MAG: hypothetical protein AB1606_00635 [Nitrospirota bacterium]